MTLPATNFARLVRLGVVAIVAAVCAPVTNAQADTRPDTPVLVIIDDSDAGTVKRSNDIARRIVVEFARVLPRHGLLMVDGESVARDFGWRLSDRKPRLELVDALKMMSRSPDAQHFHRATLILKVHARAVRKSFGARVQTDIQGEIWRFGDAGTTEFLDMADLPSDEFVAPAGCLEDATCISQVVGDRAVGLVHALAEVFARKLERHVPSASSGSNVMPVLHRFRVTLRRFEDVEALTIIGTMADEFPGYEDVDLIEKAPALRSYNYLTTATAARLDEWFAILLTDMGFRVGRDVIVRIDGTEIVMEKMYPAASGSGSEQRTRFR